MCSEKLQMWLTLEADSDQSKCKNNLGYYIIVDNWKQWKSLQSQYCSLKVPIIPKHFFRLTKSLHLFETHSAFLPLFNPNIDLLQAVKVTKSGHHLSHDRASMGLFLV